MSITGSFDWFQLSKINEKQPNVSAFADLIRHAHFGEELERVPLSLRKKLLVAFQSSSNQIKNRYLQSHSVIQQLQVRKKAILCNIGSMKQDLQASMFKIKSDKTVIEQKKKLIAKMKQRVKKKQQGRKSPKKSEVFYCPLCGRQDFTSRQQFSFHMIKEHSQKNEQQNKQSFPTQIKQLILSLKDKQIELMQMMLQKKKQMETLELQKLYELQIKKIKTQANFHQRKSMFTTQIGKKIKSEQLQQNNQPQQLKGQSQYLFYQSQSNNRRYQKQVEDRFYHNFYRHSDIQPRTERYTLDYMNEKKMLKEQERRDYYNIFGDDVAVSVDNSLSPHKIIQYSPNINQHTQIQQSRVEQLNSKFDPPKTAYFQQNSFQPRQPQPSQTPLHPSKNPIQIKSHLYRPSEYESANQKKQLSQKSSQNSYLKSQSNSNISNSDTNKKYQSIYKQRSKISVKDDDDMYIFNSGPLMDDNEGDSDYEDYFQRKDDSVSNDEVIDQEIKAIKPKSMANYQFSKFNTVQYQQLKPAQMAQVEQSYRSEKREQNKSNISNVLLEYSKDRSCFQVSNSQQNSSSKVDISNMKQKSSDFIELSNSFSKRGFESSKNNDETINLSDLKLSKLEKQRQAQKKYYQHSKQENDSLVQLKNPEYQKINQRIFTYMNQNRYESNSNILQQFKRQQKIQEQQYRMKNMTVKRTQKIQSVDIENKKQQIINKIKSIPQDAELMKTNPKVLQQFMYKLNQ